MIDNQNNVQTSVQQVDLDIDSWLGAPGADSIVTPSTGNPTGETTELKPNIFSKEKQDLSFLDKEDDEDDSSKDDEKDKTPKVISKEETNHLIDNLDLEEDEETKGKAGRPKTDKSGLVGFLKKRIESKEMFAFDDYDETKQDLEEYLGTLGEKDIEELWQANIDNMKSEVAAKTPQEFFESLPEELQYAAKYVADGGQDLKGLFKVLSHVEETFELDPTEPNHQERIVREYLSATNFGTPDEIQEEIDRLSEHMRFLGIKPVSSLSRVLEVSGVGEAKTNISSMEMISDLLGDHKKMISMFNDAAVEAENQKSRGTINLLDDLNEAHGKFVWMLRSYLKE